MDWNYMLSIKPEEIADDDKDELMNTIAWYDCELEELDLQKSSALFKISQIIMRYKAEQVEALVAELDELATKQAEEDIKKESEADTKSLRSRKSSSLDTEELEEKYRETKTKLKLQLKTNDKHTKELNKLKQHVKLMEQERMHLQNELQSLQHDDAHSDISETIKDQHKELIDSVRQKNKQITSLLNDIEVVESENVVLKEQLVNVRDELSDATKRLTKLTDALTACELKTEEKSEIVESLNREIDGLRLEIQDLHEDKRSHEKQIEDFAIEIDSRIEEWKSVLNEKNEEMKELKIRAQQNSQVSSEVFDHEAQNTQIAVLNETINNRDDKIFELQKQLQNATKEMDESTKVLNSLSSEREANINKVHKLAGLMKELKLQLKASHHRCQELQEEVKFLDKLSTKKDKDINDLLGNLKDHGQIELSNALSKVQDLKMQKRYKEKQVSSLVRAGNKLQDNFDVIEKENNELRARLGFSEDDPVYVVSVASKQRKQRREFQSLEKKAKNLEEEKLTMRLELQRLNRTVATLSSRLTELGEVPDVDHLEQAVDDKQDPKETVERDKHVAVVEENEALRKGLHEILQGLQSQSSTNVKEIKSETLEQLLRALDVKHISGWYHPAMRLQAELHALQGVNSELRQQLLALRQDKENYRQESKLVAMELPELQVPKITSTNNSEIISNLNKHLTTVLNEYHTVERSNETMKNKLEKYRNDFQITQQQVSLLYRQYHDEKSQWMDEKEQYSNKDKDLTEKLEILEMQLSEITKFTSNDDQEKFKQILDMSANVVTLNRKCLYLENENSKLVNKLENTQSDLSKAEITTVNKINRLIAEKNNLSNRINILEIELEKSRNWQSDRNDFDELTMKHRELLSDFTNVRTWKENQIDLVNETVDSLKNEKDEILTKLQDLIVKLKTIEISTLEVDKAKEMLCHKLAQSEVNEITERQRANHTNNLYELVKEQLRKSEDRYNQFNAYNKEIMRKNLTLQENLKKLQDKVLDNVAPDEFKNLQDRYVKLLDENARLKSECNSMQIDFEELKNKEVEKIASISHESEILSLKHQILDLQAATDDKAVIARLSSDVIHARLSEAESLQKLENTMIQLEKAENRCVELNKKYEDDLENNIIVVTKLKNKISFLQDTVKQQREQYYGSIPLTSERKFIANIIQSYNDKHSAFLSLHNAERVEKECETFKEQLRVQMSILDEFQSLQKSDDFEAKIGSWCNEKCSLQLQEMKHRRKSEFVQYQLEAAVHRIELQEQQLSKLEEELLVAHRGTEIWVDTHEDARLWPLEKETEHQEKKIECNVKLYISQETQTIFESPDTSSDSVDAGLNGLQVELIDAQNELSAKEEVIQQLKTKTVEQEMNLSLFRRQLGDKQSQISFYEKHILDLQTKKEVETSDDDFSTSQELVGLKATLSALQANLVEKDECILKYQALLKQDRDEHSLAAARMQDELKQLQNLLVSQQKSHKELKETQTEERPGKAAIEHYIRQVHALEKHTSDLHTSVSTLESQLQCAREECVRWRGLANDRLDGIEDLRKEMDEMHRNELAVYKTECEKWRLEVTNLKVLISKLREEPAKQEIFQKALKEKDEKIHELSVVLRQTRNELRKKPEVTESPKVVELGTTLEQIVKEHETLKKRFEQLMSREKNAREEIRNLKAQLMRRPASSTRSDKTDVLKEQLQKKVPNLEKEVEELKENLQRQLAINETHRIKVGEDFEKWNKQKYWQQTSEKLKAKLKEKSEEFEKVQQTCASYRVLIERLEREKHALENKNKMLRNVSSNVGHAKLEMLEIENAKLHTDLEALSSKLEMQQHHSGSLGATMLQEKLEGQERKIAILELSAKGTGELRAEMERLCASNANLQKMNLRLEAESLEFKLDLEKSSKELPHLREQVQHLESYIEVLKSEGAGRHEVTSSGDHQVCATETKKVSELERTVFILKRIVEKLQAENRRLQAGNKPCASIGDRTVSDEKLRRDFHRLREQYGDSVQKIARLEDELAKVSKLKNKPSMLSDDVASLTEELSFVKNQLSQKSELLDKVKVLLHRAAIKEKSLLDEISKLKAHESTSSINN